MAKSFRPADLPERDGDIELATEQLVNLSFFARLSEKVKESLARYPGFMQLRRYRKGEVICRQGAEACTSFFILREVDLFYLRDVLGEPGDEASANAGRELDTIKAMIAAIRTDRREALSRLYGQRREIDQRLQDALKRKAKNEADLLRARRQELWDQSCQEPERYARVFLATGSKPRVKSSAGLLGWFRKKPRPTKAGPDLPRSLPFDGPTSIDFRSRQASLNEGELFGEMACLYRRPRSATVVAQRDGYLLEMLSSILEEIDKDPAYQKERDEVYRNRVLDLQLRDLSFFRDLSDQQFNDVFAVLRPLVELERYDAGQLICDEFERSECMYLVREGLVQVKKNVSCLLQMGDIVDWQHLCALLRAGAGSVAPFRRLLPEPIVGWLVDEPTRAEEAKKPELVFALNDVLKNPRLAASLEFKDLLAGPALGEQLPDVPQKPKERTEQHQRRINRWLLEAALPGSALRRYRKIPGPDQILTYLSRGEYFGEMGLLRHQPRNATCIAFGQPQRSQYGSNEHRLVWEHKPYKPTTLEFKKPESIEPQKDTGRIELVRISESVFQHLLDVFPMLHDKVAAEVARREQHTREKLASPARYHGNQGLFSGEASRLGLIQGQKLMLIDLERCTRCDECVKACVDTHNDGHSRLHLIGPHFDKYLVPTTCRSCLDPVCMIGCPVRSIQRGENRQMEIKDWCIGCAKCAKQCPYDSIQIHPLEPSGQPAAVETDPNQIDVTTRAVVCDLCSTLPQGPACVYACPHDAALRIDARSEFRP